MRTGWLMGALALCCAAATQAGWSGEFLLAPADSRFVFGWEAPAGHGMREYVPRGETVENWTRMVTLQRFGYRAGMTPAAVLARTAALMQAACPGATVTPGESVPLAGHVSATIRVDCPRNPQTGKPETMFARAVLGDDALHMVQAATRRVPTIADVRWAAGVLQGAVLCTASDVTSRCGTARAATPGAAL